MSRRLGYNDSLSHGFKYGDTGWGNDRRLLEAAFEGLDVSQNRSPNASSTAYSGRSDHFSYPQHNGPRYADEPVRGRYTRDYHAASARGTTSRNELSQYQSHSSHVRYNCPTYEGTSSWRGSQPPASPRFISSSSLHSYSSAQLAIYQPSSQSSSRHTRDGSSYHDDLESLYSFPGYASASIRSHPTGRSYTSYNSPTLRNSASAGYVTAFRPNDTIEQGRDCTQSSGFYQDGAYIDGSDSETHSELDSTTWLSENGDGGASRYSDDRYNENEEYPEDDHHDGSGGSGQDNDVYDGGENYDD